MAETVLAAGPDEELEERPPRFQALYEHWERTRWSMSDLDYALDRASFEALDEAGRERMLWLFTHRFDGESTVARLMTPFVSAAPDLDVQLLMSTQLVDEMRHVKVIVRIYEEVFGVTGGLPAVQAVADARRDPFTGRMYTELERWIAQLAADPNPDNYLCAVTAYHIIGEGVLARVSTMLSTPVFESWGDFPGILRGQQLVSRDESRHIGIGVTYARREVQRDAERARALIGDTVAQSVAFFEQILDEARHELDGDMDAHYGATADRYWGEMGRLLQVRLRSVGAL